MAELWQDFTYAIRVLLHRPGYTVPAVLVLALGIGASTTVFTAVNAVMGRLPYADDQQLVRIFEQNSPTNRWTTSVSDFQAIASQAHTLTAVGALRVRQLPVSAGAEPRTMAVVLATSGFARALGVQPSLGRGIEPSDDATGAPPVTVVTDAFARSEFGAGANALGRSILIDGRAYTVVGVWGRGVDRLAGTRGDVWPALQLDPPVRRGPFGLGVIGRLAEGATLDAARRELADVSARLLPLWSDFHDRNAKLTPYSLREVMRGSAGRTLGVFGAAVLLVLLIAVANVASLSLVRATGRWRELSLRAALGATRHRLVRMVMVESAALAAAGGALGLALGAGGLRLLVAIGPFIPRLDEAHLDVRAVGFASVVAVVAGLVIGAYPILMLVRRDPGTSLAGDARSVGGGRGSQGVRGAFVVGEFALALPLLAIAGLLLNSFLRLQQVAPGFDPQQVATVAVSLPAGRYPDQATLTAFWTRALLDLHQVPGITGVGLSNALPPAQSGDDDNFDLVDHPVGDGNTQPVTPTNVVSRDYFETLRIPLLDGRPFTAADTGTGPPTLIVSRSWAGHYFPGERAVGRHLIQGGCTACPLTTIVGVVGDVKYEGLGNTSDAMYNPMEQGWGRNLHVFVRGHGAGDDALHAAEAVLRGIDPGISLDHPQAMNDVVYDSITQPRHLTSLLMGFAVAALALAGVGIFGLLSYTVAARRREIGVRMALGADAGGVIRLIVIRGLAFAGAGAGVGLVLAVIGTRWVAGALFAVSPTDPVTLIAVTVVLLVVALVACWLPARRAARIDPVAALRLEG